MKPEELRGIGDPSIIKESMYIPKF